MAYPSHEPTKQSRELVSLHATMGTRQEVIADLLDIDPKTLRKHYRKELDHSTAKANATIGGVLFNKAKQGDTTAMIFWMKTRAGWKEKTEVEHSGNMGLTITAEDYRKAEEEIMRELDGDNA